MSVVVPLFNKYYGFFKQPSLLPWWLVTCLAIAKIKGSKDYRLDKDMEKKKKKTAFCHHPTFSATSQL
jgi:hypothetical protein